MLSMKVSISTAEREIFSGIFQEQNNRKKGTAVTPEDLFDSFKIMIGSDGLSFLSKTKILEDILGDQKALDSLGLKIIDLIDIMLKQTNDNEERRELAEMRLIALQTLYYPDSFLLKNGIDINRLFLDHLDQIKNEDISEKEAELLRLFISCDIKYAKYTEEHLLNFLDYGDRVTLLYKMDQNRNVFESKTNSAAAEEAGYYHRMNQRFHIILQVFLTTHPQRSAEVFYFDFPIRYAYENVCTDWYWAENKSYDCYVSDRIISPKESDTLHKIGKIITDRSTEMPDTDKEEKLLDLFDEFIDHRNITDILFPDFLRQEN